MKVFKEQFIQRKDIGHEYFEGDLHKMKYAFMQIVCELDNKPDDIINFLKPNPIKKDSKSKEELDKIRYEREKLLIEKEKRKLFIDKEKLRKFELKKEQNELKMMMSEDRNIKLVDEDKPDYINMVFTPFPI